MASADFLRAAARALEPLRDEGIDEIVLGRGDEGRAESVHVARDDLPASNG